MKSVNHPPADRFELTRLLHALSDPTRLKLVRLLAEGDQLPCAALCLGRPKSSMSHHFKTMIDAGLLRVEVAGNMHLNSLRLDEIEGRFPGLMTVILSVADCGSNGGG